MFCVLHTIDNGDSRIASVTQVGVFHSEAKKMAFLRILSAVRSILDTEQIRALCVRIQRRGK